MHSLHSTPLRAALGVALGGVALLMSGCPDHTCTISIEGDTGIPVEERAVFTVTACLDGSCSQGTVDTDASPNQRPFVHLSGGPAATFTLSAGALPTWQYQTNVHPPSEFRDTHDVSLEIMAANGPHLRLRAVVNGRENDESCLWMQADM
jgi:hypothetical protein